VELGEIGSFDCVLEWIGSSCIECERLKCLGALNSGGWGVFIAPTTKTAVGEGCCRWAHRTVCPVRQPRHPTVRVLTVSTVGALTSWCTGQSGAAPDSYCSVSGAPLAPALTSARTVHALFTLLQTTVGRIAVAPLGAPDSLVNYSGVAFQKPEGGKFEVAQPWAPDTVRWHTGQYGEPD
jgi:hypothetical protein